MLGFHQQSIEGSIPPIHSFNPTTYDTTFASSQVDIDAHHGVNSSSSFSSPSYDTSDNASDHFYAPESAFNAAPHPSVPPHAFTHGYDQADHLDEYQIGWQNHTNRENHRLLPNAPVIPWFLSPEAHVQQHQQHPSLHQSNGHYSSSDEDFCTSIEDTALLQLPLQQPQHSNQIVSSSAHLGTPSHLSFIQSHPFAHSSAHDHSQTVCSQKNFIIPQPLHTLAVIQDAISPSSTTSDNKVKPTKETKPPKPKKPKFSEINQTTAIDNTLIAPSATRSTPKDNLRNSNSPPPPVNSSASIQSPTAPSSTPSPPPCSTNTSRLRKSAVLAATFIKSEANDGFDSYADEDDDSDPIVTAPGSKKRKRGEQQKAKHNVAERRRRVEMSEAMDRIKACLSRSNEFDEKTQLTKVSILTDTAQHLENLQRENERLKLQVQSLNEKVVTLEEELSTYRGESEDTTSMASTPGNENRPSPRSRLMLSLSSATLLTVIFCMTWSPAMNFVQTQFPGAHSYVARTLLASTEKSTYGFVFSAMDWIAKQFLPIISFWISLIFMLYVYSIWLKPVIRDPDVIASHLETVTAIHSARIINNNTAWKRALKLANELSVRPPSSKLLAFPYLIYESLRFLALSLKVGIYLERLVFLARGIPLKLLERQIELEVSLAQCLVEVCPKADWSILVVMLRALNWCDLASNERGPSGEEILPLYKLKLWTFASGRLRTHFTWSYRIFAWYCSRRMDRYKKQANDMAAPLRPNDPKLVVDFPSSLLRAQHRTTNSKSPLQDMLSSTFINSQNTKCIHNSPRTFKNKSTTIVQDSTNSGLTTIDSASSNIQQALSDKTDDEAENSKLEVDQLSNPSSAQHDSTLSFNITMPNAYCCPDAQEHVDFQSERRSIETTYRSVCLVHEIASHMLSGRLESAAHALTELIAIRKQHVPSCSRVTLNSLHTAHVLPFTRWGALRTQLLHALVQGIRGLCDEAIEECLHVKDEAQSTGDVETYCAAVMLATHFYIENHQLDQAIDILSSIINDRASINSLMADDQQYCALRAAWILLEASGAHHSDPHNIDERFIVELKHFVHALETRRDHRFETLFYLTCVVGAALDVWESLAALAKESLASLNGDNNTSIVIAQKAMIIERQASTLLSLKLLSKRAVELLGCAASTGTFFAPAYHFYHGKLLLLSNRDSNVSKAQKEFDLSLRASASAAEGKWSTPNLQDAIQQLQQQYLDVSFVQLDLPK